MFSCWIVGSCSRTSFICSRRWSDNNNSDSEQESKNAKRLLAARAERCRNRISSVQLTIRALYWCVIITMCIPIELHAIWRIVGIKLLAAKKRKILGNMMSTIKLNTGIACSLKHIVESNSLKRIQESISEFNLHLHSTLPGKPSSKSIIPNLLALRTSILLYFHHHLLSLHSHHLSSSHLISLRESLTIL